MKNKSVLEKLLYAFEACFFLIFVAYQLSDGLRTDMLATGIKIGAVLSIAFLSIYIYINLKNEKKDAAVIVMFLALTYMITAIL